MSPPNSVQSISCRQHRNIDRERDRRGQDVIDERRFGWGTINAGNVVDLNVRLPSNSTLLPKVTLRDASGALVADEDGNPSDGHFRRTITADGNYYAQVESPWSYDGHAYLLTNAAMTWTNAEALAQSMGGRIVTINDEDEQNWLWRTFAPVACGSA
jgi:hypothetical protein